MRNRPSTHFILLILLLILNGLAYVAIYNAGVVRGFNTSILLAVRDLLLFLPIFFIFVWLARRYKYAGDWTLITIAILLFGIGQFMQYRLFTDPEYSERGVAAARARQSKSFTLQQRYINQYYGADKMKSLFGDPKYKIKIGSDTTASNNLINEEDNYWTIGRVLTSPSTWIPLFAFLGFGIAFSFFKRDDLLLLIQRNSFIIGILTTVPFIVIAILYSSGGKFLGNTTPWEPVKITFLVSFAGILTQHYRNLSRTYWGVPSWRILLPFMAAALLPVIPFFALSDFGQMLIFFGAYLTLYIIAVRRLPQVTAAIVLVVILLFVSISATGIVKTAADIYKDGNSQVSVTDRLKDVVSRGVPRRIHQRFYLWVNGGVAPNPDTTWWWRDEAADAQTRGLSNEEAWYNKYAFQPMQALFGVSDGMLLGKGLGRGYPESVPIADSDFIYAAIAEETGVVGGGVIIFAYIILLAAGLRTSIEARDMFTKLVSAGIVTFLAFQALVNIGGVIRLLPMTGITLPFVSHGGWSLMTAFFMLGMLVAISHRNGQAVSSSKFQVSS